VAEILPERPRRIRVQEKIAPIIHQVGLLTVVHEQAKPVQQLAHVHVDHQNADNLAGIVADGRGGPHDRHVRNLYRTLDPLEIDAGEIDSTFRYRSAKCYPYMPRRLAL
jgi:hypothetical protein